MGSPGLKTAVCKTAGMLRGGLVTVLVVGAVAGGLGAVRMLESRCSCGVACDAYCSREVAQKCAWEMEARVDRTKILRISQDSQVCYLVQKTDSQ
jgi:hypothetical protein